MVSQVSVPPIRHASASLISRLCIELTGEPASLRSIFVSHVLNVATLQNKLSKLGTKAYQVQYREKNIKVRDGGRFSYLPASPSHHCHTIFSDYSDRDPCAPRHRVEYVGQFRLRTSQVNVRCVVPERVTHRSVTCVCMRTRNEGIGIHLNLV
jgi:hypothetical protein